MRKLSFNDAKRQFTNRYTLDHIPAWAWHVNPGNGKYYAPQYASDREWYDRTFFNGESDMATSLHCYSRYPTWPIGQWLETPFKGVNHG